MPDESASMTLSKELKRRADPEFMPPDDPRPRLVSDPSTEPISTRADESAGTTGGSSSSAPAGRRPTRSRSPPRFGQVREVVPASAAGSGRAAEGAANAAPRVSGDPADADKELHSLEHEISILETSLSRLGLGELNSIVEVFGPGRVCNTAEMLGISSGQAFDLRLADPDDNRSWDLSIASKRHKVWWKIVELGPWLVVGSPPCDPSSSLHYLNAKREDPVKRAESIRRGIVHLAFCFAIYRERANMGRYFLHEHSWGAWSWRFDFVQAFLKREDVFLGRGGQCPFGQKATDWYGEGSVLKPIGWLRNSPSIVSKVAVRCPSHYVS